MSASNADGHGGRDVATKRAVRMVAAQAAAVSAAVHLLWAWPRLGTGGDPRPAVFVLGGAFAVAVAVATLRAPEYRRLYALGAGTLAAFLLGYVGWHGAAVGAALATEPLAIVAKGAEVVGVLAFLALYRLAPPTSVVLERRDDAEGTGNDPGETGNDIGETGNDGEREADDAARGGPEP
jgi:hypothetical protein